MPQEVNYRINRLLYDGRATVTTSPQQLLDLFSSFNKEEIGLVKTIEITNNTTASDVYYGRTALVTTANAGGILRASERIEIPLVDLNHSPYFIAGANTVIYVLVWG